MPKKIKVKSRVRRQTISSGHLITSRPPGSSGRIFVLLSFAFLALMTLMSVYALTINPTSPGFWATFVFFAGLLAFLLLHEDNALPALDREKIIYFISSWFLAFLVVPYLILQVTSFNFAMFLVIIILLIMLIPLLTRLILTQTQWLDFKQKTKASVKTNISKLRPSTKRKVINGRLTGQNRRRKIYRR
jgi:hypothetical protein